MFMKKWKLGRLIIYLTISQWRPKMLITSTLKAALKILNTGMVKDNKLKYGQRIRL